MARAENRHKKMSLNTGDEVTEIKTGKKYNVIIDTPPRVRGEGMFKEDTSPTVDKVKYIVNGKSYNWKEFMAKFGKSIYDVKPGDAPVSTEAGQSYRNVIKVHSVTKID